MQQGWLRPADLQRRFMAQPGRTGNAVLRHLSDSMSDGAAAHSERVQHAIVRRAGMTGWSAYFDLWHEGSLVAVLDLAFPELALAVEVDGMAFHTDSARFQNDRTRQNRVVGLGWTVLRFTWADLSTRPDYVVRTISHAMALIVRRRTHPLSSSPHNRGPGGPT